MDTAILQKMDAPELIKYIEFLLWHYRVVDAFWFIYVAERFDQPTAEDLISRFDIREKGIGRAHV